MNKTIKALFALSLGFTTCLAGCDVNAKDDPNGTGNVQTISVTSLSLNKTNLSLAVGGTETLVATVSPENASNKSVTWESTNENVAMVDSNGTVIAIANGTAVIKAKSVADPTKFAICAVSVGGASTVGVTGITLNKTETSIVVGGNETLVATVTPANATNKLVTWSSNKPDVASVDPTTGKVTANKIGSAKITATTVDGGFSASCTVLVNSQSQEEDEEYTVKCIASGGVTPTLSKTKAKKGETVTLTLAYDAGYSFKSIRASGTTLTTVSEGTSYSFVMGNVPVTINVETTVEGDIVINGEFNAVFAEEDEGSGIFIARNVSVPTAKTRYGFNLSVNGTTVKGINMDESRCDGDIASGSGSYQFSIGAGATYDFFFDSNKSSYNFYGRRTKIDLLPNNTSTLESVFKGGSMHSQSALHPQGLTSIHYEKKSLTETYNYDYKIFNDGTAFGHTEDKTDPDITRHYYTWKSVDLTNNLYKVVNTWPKSLGNNEAEDDLWAKDPHNDSTHYGKPYSGKFDIVDNDIEDLDFNRQYMIKERDAVRTLNSAAHYGAALEYEIYESYRGDFSGSAVIGAANAAGSHITVESTAEAGGFKTVVNSQLEWNRAEDSYESAAHEAVVYTNEFHFLTNGSLKSMDYSETFYSQTQWDFTNHAPLSGATGRKTTIKVTNGYDEATAPNLGTFNPDDYFISSIDSLSLYNSKTGKTYSDSISYLNYNDLIELIPYGNGGEKTSIVHDYEFSPSTALDAWQYHVASVTDDSVVGVNHQNTPIVCGIGQSEVTFTNRVTNDPAHVSKTITVEGIANGTVNAFFINSLVKGYDSYGAEHAEKITATAGKTMRYWVEGSNNTGAPVAYSIVFKEKNQYGDYEYKETSDYCTIVETGNVLVINCDTPAANALTSKKVLTLVLMSDFYKDGFGPTQFELTIMPNTGSVVGSSYTIARGNGDYATMVFANAAADANGWRNGVIKDFYVNAGKVDTFSFIYKLDNNNNIVDSDVVSVDIQSNSLYGADEKISTVASDYVLFFDGFDTDGGIKFALYYDSIVFTEDGLGNEYGFVFGDGDMDSDGYMEIAYCAKGIKD